MLSVYLAGWVAFYCIVGSLVMIWPGKTRAKVAQMSATSVRVWGLIVFLAGIWLAVAAILFNNAIHL